LKTYRKYKGSLKRIFIGAFKIGFYLVIGTACLYISGPFLGAGLIAKTITFFGLLFIEGALYQALKNPIRFLREIPD